MGSLTHFTNIRVEKAEMEVEGNLWGFFGESYCSPSHHLGEWQRNYLLDLKLKEWDPTIKLREAG